MTAFPPKTDDELLRLDVPSMLRFGLPAEGHARRALFGDGAIAAAVTLGRLGVLPRSVAYLARVVRAGGAAYAAALDLPLPGEAPARTAGAWLAAAAGVAGGVDDDETLARWFEAVAALMELRLTAGTSPAP
ncbi:hypothetical protein AB0B79_19835 [Streptomyces sp. NPDC039022]|uniref:hypothetical protein n=1 Tax=unclassified Streptomyces TaxID=2593676 RepID=UPI0033E84F6B